MSLQYILDTNICIYISKRQPLSVLAKFEQVEVGAIGMSIITYGELFYGCQKSREPEKSMAALDDLIRLIPPLAMPVDAARYYSESRYSLEKMGSIIGNNDLWIAAHGLALGLTIVTNNLKEFSRIKALKVENWVN